MGANGLCMVFVGDFANLYHGYPKESTWGCIVCCLQATNSERREHGVRFCSQKEKRIVSSVV